MVTMAAALVMVAGGSTAAMRSSQGEDSAMDVCALLPREEAGKILGYAVRARAAKRSDGPATECRYAGGTQGTVTVMVGTGTPKAKWDAFMKQLKESGATLEPVAGLGDGAFFWDAHRLYAHIANYQIAVSTTPSAGDDLGKVRANAIAMAKATIAKLKG
jgi:hypothetical protein